MSTHQPLPTPRMFVFDMDGTLARSKTPMDGEMDALLCQLLERCQVAIIGGGWLPVFQWQVLDRLSASPEQLVRLHLMPTSSAKYLRYDDGAWKEVYALELSKEERARILQAFEDAFKQVGYTHPEELYGDVIEDRGTRVPSARIKKGPRVGVGYAGPYWAGRRRRLWIEN